MPSWPEKRVRWSDPAVARAYDARRFAGARGRAKARRDARLVLALLARHAPDGRVLDLPCGTGRLLPALAAAGRRPVGADLAAAMLAEAPRAAAPLVRAEAERPPFRDDAFAACVALRFLFHVDDRSTRVALLAALARVAPVLVVQVRRAGGAKRASRALRRSPRLGSAPTRAALEAELADAGLALAELAPVARLFSDKALAVCRRDRPVR